MEATADYYTTLGVEPDADSAAIRIAYRNLMRRYHPDVNASEEALNKATAINEAYACLSDGDRREAYDYGRKRGQQTHHGFAPQPAWQPPPQYRPSHPYHRRPNHDLMADLKFLLNPRQWNWVNLGLAMLITGCTFTATSFVAPIVPAPAETVVSTAAPGSLRCDGDRARGATPDCERLPQTP